MTWWITLGKYAIYMLKRDAHALRQYTKVCLLFILAMSITWLPSSANRIYSLAKDGRVSPALALLDAFVLPLQGCWNALIYIYMSRDACRSLVLQVQVSLRGFCGKVARKTTLQAANAMMEEEKSDQSEIVADTQEEEQKQKQQQQQQQQALPNEPASGNSPMTGFLRGIRVKASLPRPQRHASPSESLMAVLHHPLHSLGLRKGPDQEGHQINGGVQI